MNKIIKPENVKITHIAATVEYVYPWWLRWLSSEHNSDLLAVGDDERVYGYNATDSTWELAESATARKRRENRS